jgi:hypothetical protein
MPIGSKMALTTITQIMTVRIVSIIWRPPDEGAA